MTDLEVTIFTITQLSVESTSVSYVIRSCVVLHRAELLFRKLLWGGDDSSTILITLALSTEITRSKPRLNDLGPWTNKKKKKNIYCSQQIEGEYWEDSERSVSQPAASLAYRAESVGGVSQLHQPTLEELERLLLQGHHERCPLDRGSGIPLDAIRLVIIIMLCSILGLHLSSWQCMHALPVWSYKL
jgi:hypothetical protein